MKVAYTNHGTEPCYIGPVLLLPGQTREVDAQWIPAPPIDHGLVYLQWQSDVDQLKTNMYEATSAVERAIDRVNALPDDADAVSDLDIARVALETAQNNLDALIAAEPQKPDPVPAKSKSTKKRGA